MSVKVGVVGGEIDFHVMLRTLAESGYDGYLALEYQWEEALDSNRVDCIGETADLRDLLLTPGGGG
jgi:hypothetical protein